MSFERESTRVGEVFETLIKNQDSVRLSIWIGMIEVEIMRQRGYKDGRAAGTWVFDGNAQEEYFMKIQQGVRDGDPKYLDMLPHHRLNGEFADDPTWNDIVAEEMDWDKGSIEFFDTDHMYEAYTTAFHQGVEDEVLAYGSHSVKTD